VQEIKDEDGEPYSSTRIRDHLRHGRPVDAARLLGRPFEIEGEVIRGDERGRMLGFPTANLRLGEYLRPAGGVYAVRVRWREGGNELVRPAVANFGVRPTFGGGAEPLFEVHLFDFVGDLYGRALAIELIDYLRPEKKFDGLDHLRAQIVEDCARARRLLARDDNDRCMRAAGS
jgi:riboflavin kinase/FMN adenylyltransferase